MKRGMECSECPSKNDSPFKELACTDLEKLSCHKVTNLYKKGQTLFVEGSPSYGTYCISKGNVKLTKQGEDGRESIVRIASAGDILGHRSLFSNENFKATATALEDSVICFIDKQYIYNLIKENPSVALNVIQKLSTVLGSCEEKIASGHQKNIFQRTCEVLLILNQTHGEEFSTDGETHHKINLKLTREELASYVGTSAETLIRTLSDLKSEGTISQDGKFIVLNKFDKILEYSQVQ
ncbi:Crp/Fnr family transcriptional regulator [Bacteriovoracaceae bacterium]|nr:Crp/Fnr family transcriptional regulator [Bacteriovoracaceae bacterium]